MLVLREDDLQVLEQAMDSVCAARNVVGKTTDQATLGMVALELYRKGFRETNTLIRLLERMPAAFHR